VVQDLLAGQYCEDPHPLLKIVMHDKPPKAAICQQCSYSSSIPGPQRDVGSQESRSASSSKSKRVFNTLWVSPGKRLSFCAVGTINVFDVLEIIIVVKVRGDQKVMIGKEPRSKSRSSVGRQDGGSLESSGRAGTGCSGRLVLTRSSLGRGKGVGKRFPERWRSTGCVELWRLMGLCHARWDVEFIASVQR